MKKLGKLFGAELVAAGCNDSVAWTDDGTILGWDEMSAQKQAAIQAVIDAHDPDAVPRLHKIYKSTIWRRATDAEGALMSSVLAAAPARLRELYTSVEYLDDRDPDFQMLAAGIAQAIGAERAAVILEPEF